MEIDLYLYAIHSMILSYMCLLWYFSFSNVLYTYTSKPSINKAFDLLFTPRILRKAVEEEREVVGIHLASVDLLPQMLLPPRI